MKSFSIRKALSYGFHTALEHILFFVVAMGTAFVAGLTGILIFVGINWSTFSFLIMRVPEVCGFMFTEALPTFPDIQTCVLNVLNFFMQHWILYSGLLLLGFLIFFLISIYCMLGWMNSLLYIYDHRKSSFGSLFVSWRLILPFILASILYFLIVTCGFILLVIPGIIFSIKFGFYGLVIVDKKVGAVEALRQSSQITQGGKWKLFLLGLSVAALASGISFLGFLLHVLFGNIEFMASMLHFLNSLLNGFLYIVASLAGVYTYRVLNAQTITHIQYM